MRAGRARPGDPRWVAAVAVTIVSLALAGTALAEPVAVPVEQRLAMQFARISTNLIKGEAELSLRNIEAAVMLAQEAVRLDPKNAEIWRLVMRMAILAEREDLLSQAVDQITRLDPADDVVRLMRINLALERYDSVEQRIAAYERVLEPKVRNQLGVPVASRLMLDLALLQRRHGDLDGFAMSLGEAAAIDPANRAAAAIAAGFFRVNVADPYAEAELLTNLLIADPTDVTIQAALAELFLHHGAYGGAERFYSLSSRNQDELRVAPAGELLGDQAVAHWANGHSDEALRLIRERQQAFDQQLRGDTIREDAGLDPLERARITAHLRPTLAAVRAAIHVAEGSVDAVRSITRALAAYDAVIAAAEEAEDPDPATVARLRLEKAWVGVWLSGDDELVATLLAEAERYQPLSDTARALFEGWRALRRGEYDVARERLESLPGDEAAGHLGRARIAEVQGRPKEQARALLAAVRAQPGSLIGVEAANLLATILGRRVPPSDLAKRLEELAASIPGFIDRYPDNPTLALGLRLRPIASRFSPYEPVIVNVEITNNSPYPLAIDRNGPVHPQVILFAMGSFPQVGGERPSEMIVVDIDRRLRLEPRGKLTVPVDLRWYEIGRELYTNARGGMFVELRGTLNFRATPQGAILPSLLGVEQPTITLRVDGARITSEWVTESMAALENPTDTELVRLGLLGHVLADRVTLLELMERERDELLPKTDPEARQRVIQLDELIEQHSADLVFEREPIVQAFQKMNGRSQAWLLGALPATALLEPIRDLAKVSENRLVRFMYLIYHTNSVDDPLLNAVLESDDEGLKLLAVATRDRLIRQAEIRRLPSATSGASSLEP
ncbi:MAG: hypothetical protein GY715_07950 [Planctomycetes bacterium]|nr:hypothetical protein [Planctomycetota bacterium]